MATSFSQISVFTLDSGSWQSTEGDYLNSCDRSHDRSYDPITQQHYGGPLSHSSCGSSTRAEQQVTGAEEYYVLHEASDSEDESLGSSSSSSSSSSSKCTSGPTGPCKRHQEVVKMLYRGYLEDLGRSCDSDNTTSGTPEQLDKRKSKILMQLTCDFIYLLGSVVSEPAMPTLVPQCPEGLVVCSPLWCHSALKV